MTKMAILLACVLSGAAATAITLAEGVSQSPAPQSRSSAPKSQLPAPRSQSPAPQSAAVIHIDAESVRKIQMALSAEGFDPGPANGVWGPNMAQAVLQYQQHKGF